MKADRALFALSWAVALHCSCAESHDSPPVPDAAPQRDAAPDSCVGESCGEPVCDGVWLQGPLAETTELPVVCDARLAHEPMAYYDDCSIAGGASSPESCSAPRVGAVVCEPGSGVGEGRRTTTCLADTDCPADFVCTYGGVAQPIDPAVVYSGVCERRCDDDRACLRCDLECGVTAPVAVCRNRRGPPLEPFPCVADCQCRFPYGGKCWQGFCVEAEGVYGCGPSNGCDCEGGTCGDDGCCHLPDGSIAANESPECRPDLY